MLAVLRQTFFILLLALGLFPANAHLQESREYLLKAAFLYNFAKFVEWPADSFKNESAPIHLVILGPDPFGSALETIREKSVKGRKLVIKRISRIENLEDCHLLFISASEKSQIRAILNTLRGNSILTISDLEKFTHLGGIIGLITLDNKIRFEINLEVAQRNRLKISSELLELAKIVRSGS